MIDYAALIGKKFGTLTVLERAEQDGKSNHRWLCECDCGKRKTIIGYNLVKMKSCGCRSGESRVKDLRGHRFDRWTVVSRAKSNARGLALWNCKCECGTERAVAGADLRNGSSRSCGCIQPNSPKKDMVGRMYGRLTVVRREGNDSSGGTRWLCVCSCGKNTIVSYGNLEVGGTRSCGCLFREVAGQQSYIHGHSQRKNRSPTYSSWVSMMARCNIPSATGYERYGARGISVCQRWHKFENFLADMGERPDGLSIDRIDGSGNYEPVNCRWATWTEQRINQNR
jgi:hypothetical protein